MRFSTLAAICRELDCQHIPHAQRLAVCALNRIEFARREIDLAAGRTTDPSDRCHILRRHREGEPVAADRRIVLRAQGAKRRRRKSVGGHLLDRVGIVT